MAIAVKDLNILAFPQQWDGNAIGLRFLCVPRGDPEAALRPGGPSFAAADFRFEARLIGSLAHLPRVADSVSADPQPLLLDELPLQKAALFAELRNQFKIAQPGPRLPRPTPTVRKPATDSYRELVGNRQLNGALADPDDYACALHEALAAQPEVRTVIDVSRSWGEVIAFVLRQPKLATALGLSGQASIVPPAGFFAAGGWLYVGLHASSDFGGVDGLAASFAARIPPLGDDSRDLYSLQLFPLDNEGVADEGFADLTRHDRGFARLVHAAAGDEDGDGIRLAWDDEIVAGDLARQVAGAKTSRPMATAGYRVDVRDTGADDTAWHSLQRVASVGDLTLGPLDIGAYEGETVVEVVPVQASPAHPGDFWMPPYFCTWRGTSLVLSDADLARLHRDAAIDPDFAAHRLGREQVFEAVGDRDVPLRYGHTYQFRVRLADLSRGGPTVDAAMPDDPDAHHLVEVSFRRRRKPGAVDVLERPSADARRIVLAKPRLRHPEILFTDKHRFDEVATASSEDVAAGRQRELGLPDPDVVELGIRVEVKALTGEAARWLPLYETTRGFDDDTLELALNVIDMSTFDALAAVQPNAGALIVPAARDVRFVFVAVGRDDPGYFATDAARHGSPVPVEVRAPATAEAALFAADPALEAFFLRSDPSARPLARLAQATGLDARSLTLRDPRNRRCLFGCTSGLRHILSPDGASLTLSSDADLTQRWINVLQFDLARDWTWDGLATDGLVVRRTFSRAGQADVVEIAGAIAVPRTLSQTGIAAAEARDPARTSSHIVFLDAIDPKPKPVDADGEEGQFPDELTVTYEITAALRDAVPPPDPSMVAVLLPITTPPVQVPRLISAGIALSPYDPAADYSSTGQRDRMLWLQFADPPADPQDRYFVRVLASAPDPLLIDSAVAALRPEPALPIDAETMRRIAPAQPRDDNGLAAMQPLERSAEVGPTFLVPLPDGLASSSPELLGMFTYEVRLGHAGRAWSTAQGRFGPPLRIAGVQHPPPPLVCQAARTDDHVKVRAPFATAVMDGRNLRPNRPKTRLWGVIYARVKRTHGTAWHNLLLLRLPLAPPTGDPARPPRVEAAPPLLYGEGIVPVADLARLLQRRGLPAATPLTTMAVEFMTEPEIEDPLGAKLGQARMLRVSPLVSVPNIC